MVKTELSLSDKVEILQLTLAVATIMVLGKLTTQKKLQLSLLNKEIRLFRCQPMVNQDSNGTLLDQRKVAMLS